MYNRLFRRHKYFTSAGQAIKKGSNFQYHLIVISGIFLFSINLKAQETIQVGSTTREMIVCAPSGIEQNRPLVISMHGMSQTMTDQKNQTRFESVAEANNFVLVFPNAIDKSWQLWGSTDIDFILAIIDEMYNRYGINKDRVYLSGFSMGGMMSYYAATQIADKIAAFAPVSGFLMDGPNTNSSRPIPLIHIHGADDDYVPHSSVQTHMDAWIQRNGCPTTAVVTDPYPSGATGSKSKKYYWGPGNEGVEIVFISVGGVGHWYSDDPNGIYSSQEIWDFCKKYSLKLGVLEFEHAWVAESNPKQIQVVLSKSIIDSSYFKGFTVKLDNNIVTIDSVVLSDTNQLVINLHDNILKDNDITLSYSNGNVFSTLKKELESFNDTLVDNLLIGAAPRLVEVTTNERGDTLMAKFNMKMKLPANVSTLTLNAEYNGQMSIPILKSLFFNNDSTMLSFPLGEQVYRDYNLLLAYSGSDIVSADDGSLKTFSDFQVANNSDGLPVQINAGKVEVDGITLLLEFSKKMVLKDGQSGYFTINLNGENIAFDDYSVSGNTIKFNLPKSVHYQDAVTVNYTQGNVKAADNGPLDEFSNFAATNQVNAPAWITIPGKVEAENYAFVSKMQAETTSDTDGGQNLGYIGNGSWVEYTIENTSSETDFEITFRLASPDGGSIIDFYLDGISAGRVTAPKMGDWQVYQSVVENISIGEGKHYLKIVATTAGFNFNYMDIKGGQTGIKKINEANITIYPNPVSSEMVINSVDFRHNRIEVFDVMGNQVLSRATNGEAVLHVPLHLSNGVYIVKISNGIQYQLEKIMVTNKKLN